MFSIHFHFSIQFYAVFGGGPCSLLTISRGYLSSYAVFMYVVFENSFKISC